MMENTSLIGGRWMNANPPNTATVGGITKMSESSSSNVRELGANPSQLQANIHLMEKWGAQLDRISDWIEPRRDVLTDDMMALIDSMTRESGDSRQDVLWKGLTLYLKASEAEREGRKLAILDDDDVIVEEILGIGAPLAGSAHAMGGVSGLAS